MSPEKKKRKSKNKMAVKLKKGRRRVRTRLVEQLWSKDLKVEEDPRSSHPREGKK